MACGGRNLPFENRLAVFKFADYTATDFGDTLEYFAVKRETGKPDRIPLPLKYSLITAEKRPLDAYASLVHPTKPQLRGGPGMKGGAAL